MNSEAKDSAKSEHQHQHQQVHTIRRHEVPDGVSSEQNTRQSFGKHKQNIKKTRSSTLKKKEAVKPLLYISGTFKREGDHSCLGGIKLVSRDVIFDHKSSTSNERSLGDVGDRCRLGRGGLAVPRVGWMAMQEEEEQEEKEGSNKG